MPTHATPTSAVRTSPAATHPQIDVTRPPMTVMTTRAQPRPCWASAASTSRPAHSTCTASRNNMITATISAPKPVPKPWAATSNAYPATGTRPNTPASPAPR
ncbi:hypothetical protein [Pseudonocardia acaciae]|uniref:hypothetical protein n=1 Tax=Pseudonocardia acaciae TaxID=551276 RepID=UPI0012EDFF5E|nr:hypothetical protein [Pseudonocardia acaciae]